MDEYIFVVDQTAATAFVPGEGFIVAPDDALTKLLSTAREMPRRDAEGNPAVRQIIPYVAVIKEGKAFAVTRTKKQSEARLHMKMSIGIGGHLNEADIVAGARRELQEELCVDPADLSGISFLGFINDLSSSVSRDHLGCLFILPVAGDVSVRENDKMEGEFVTLQALKNSTEHLENWSRIALKVLLETGKLY